MYSGLTISRYSGRMMGAHQQIDRIARRHLKELLPATTSFPKIKGILQFEGKNGPDGIKRKSPAVDEPWHYLNPLVGDSEEFTKLLSLHYKRLVKELRAGNQERASFEAAWLAHAVVDGLTPAHHYPYEEKLAELRGGADKSTRTTAVEKLIFRGDTRMKTVKNTLKAYGPKGLFVAHTLFELGFSVIIRPLRFPDARPSKADLNSVASLGPTVYFMRRAREVAVLDLYEQYLKKGWTSKLTRQIRQELAPIIVSTVTTLWYQAAKEAGQ